MKFKVGDKVRVKGINEISEIDSVNAKSFGGKRGYTVKGSILVYDVNELEAVEEECAMKFKVGDKVTIKSKAEIAKAYGDVDAMPGGWVESMDKYCGKTGEVVDEYADRIEVIFNDSYHWNYGAKALTPAASTVTITFNGDATTATDGEHTATVTRYHGDEYSEETGAIEAIKKLYHRFPQKGDTAYFVGIGLGIACVGSCVFDGTYEVDKKYRDSGNLYETEAAAQKVADKINAIFREVH